LVFIFLFLVKIFLVQKRFFFVFSYRKTQEKNKYRVFLIQNYKKVSGAPGLSAPRVQYKAILTISQPSLKPRS